MLHNTELPIPNHHRHHPGFAGATGLAAAFGFLRGRDGTAALACRLIELERGDRLVDIGCGPGVACRRAASLGASVIGVDPAAVMLQVARRASRSTPPGAIEWRLGTAEQIPADDHCATAVWSLATVHHWQDIDAGLAEVRRVLADGGRFLAVERRIARGATGHASHGWTPDQAESFAQSCRDRGLVGVTVSAHETDRGTELAVVAVNPAESA